jgi:hypothetical protein
MTLLCDDLVVFIAKTPKLTPLDSMPRQTKGFIRIRGNH